MRSWLGKGNLVCAISIIVVGATTIHTIPNAAEASTNIRTSAASTWQLIPSATPTDLASDIGAVSCVDANWCIGAGTGFNASNEPQEVLQRWDGYTWSLPALPATADLTRQLQGVSCVSISYCVAVGARQGSVGGVAGPFEPLLQTWNGTVWQDHYIAAPNERYNSVSCPAANNCFITGSSQAMLYLFDGSTVSTTPIPQPSINATVHLNDISCPTTMFCAAVGYFVVLASGGIPRPYAATWNGSTWQYRHSINPTTNDTKYESVSCVLPSTCMAVGETWAGRQGTAAFSETSTGAGFSKLAYPSLLTNAVVSDVSCSTATACVAVGGFGFVHTLLVEWDGTQWATSPSGTNIDVNGSHPAAGLLTVSCSTDGSCFASGSGQTPTFFLANAVTTIRTVSVAYPPNEFQRLQQVASYLGLTPEAAQKQAVYLVGYLLGFANPSPDPQTVPPATQPSAAISYWYLDEFSVLDTVRHKFVLNDADATRFSVEVLGFLLSLGGH